MSIIKRIQSLFAFVSIILFISCNSSQINHFRLEITAEIPAAIKTVMEVTSSDSLYIRKQCSLLTDVTNVTQPIDVAVPLMGEEAKEIRKKIEKARFFSLEESYGFDNDYEPNGGTMILYTLKATIDNKQKYVIVKITPETKLPKSLAELINYVARLVDKYEK